jgi:hypothetical protein
MPISSKRSGSQQIITRKQQQSVPQDNGYDDYVYYPYYSQSQTTPNDGYEYRQESDQYEEQQPKQYYQTRVTNKSAPVHRT